MKVLKVLIDTNVQFVVGESLYADFIVTRNIQDFAYLLSYTGSIAAVTPEQFLQTIADMEK